jgi:DHA2 family methylenomycin A resistance protein-like MFS transporter
VLVAVALGTILAPLNSTMIAVAVPEIASDLDQSTAAVSWLVVSYLIVVGALQPVAGRLGDRFGRRRLFLIGLAGFGLASLGAALAPNLAVLICFRVLQALAGALSFPNGAAIVRFAVPAERRGAAFGAVWAAAGGAAAVGPTLGGVIVALAGWRAMFYTSVPIAIAAIGLAVATFPRQEPLAPAAAGLRHLAGMFGSRVFACANAGIALSNLAMYTTLLAVPLLLIDGRRWSAAEAGLALTALSAPSALLSPVGGRLADRSGRRLPVVLGLTLATAGLLPLALGVDGPAPLVVCLAVAGVGFGLAFASLQTAAIEAVPPASAGSAAGLFSTSRYVGGIAGAIALGAIVHSTAGEVTGFQAIAAVIVASALLSAVAGLGLRARGRAAALAGAAT